MLTDLERCHARWQALWLGVMWLLESQDPQAYARVLEKLRRHNLLHATVAEADERGQWRERGFPQGGLIAPVPSDSLLLRARKFCDDQRPVDLRGKTRPKSPGLLLLICYHGALWHEQQRPRPRGGKRGDGMPSERAIEFVAGRFGYTPDVCRREIARARRALPPAERKRVKRSGQEAWQKVAQTFPPSA